MSITYVPADLRRLVEARAEGLCEYCLIADEDTYLGCQVDHIISEKHGGPTEADNLAVACTYCNQAKGSDLGSLQPGTNQLVRFFNPRTDRWGEHFRLVGDRIEALTPIGEATARIFGFNRHERLLERRTLRELGRYPSEVAIQRIAT
jgi:hypothetical protein